MDTKHPKIAGKELARPTQDQQQKPKAQWSIPGPTLKKLYIARLDRFLNDESKGIMDYESFMAQIDQSIMALGADQQEQKRILTELQAKIKRIRNDEIAHLEALEQSKKQLEADPPAAAADPKIYEVNYMEKDTYKPKTAQFTRKELAVFYQEKPYEQIIDIHNIRTP
jgi:hypothetical protein